MNEFFETNMLTFWAVALGLTIGVAVILIRATVAPAGTDTGQYLRIYRDQLVELDRDLSRGVVPADEAERLKTEISRRLLVASETSPRPVRTDKGIIGFALICGALAAALVLYIRIGAPGYSDMPNAPRIDMLEAARAERPTQAEAEALVPPQAPSPDAAFAGLVAQLRLAVDRNPTDLRGQQLLARNEAALGNFGSAVAAQRRAMDLQTGINAGDYAFLAELLVQAAGGYVSPEAEKVLDVALQQDPRHPLALYLAGLMMAQGGRDDLAFRHFSLALQVGPADAYWRTSVLDAMPRIAVRAGMQWTPPAADDMSVSSDAATDAAITGMVDGLARRLQDQGGSADEWARLIHSYGVLGRDEDARTALRDAGSVLTGPDLELVHAAAIQAGIVQ